jgi:hypothetical protein
MTKRLLTLIMLFTLSLKSLADEGMWLPQLLQTLNEKEMKKMGMKINASDIYNINKSSLKDAIVSLGGFCTAEVISDKGLILTNHHCGFDAIQNHSTLEHNYIQNGFWAYDTKQEIPNQGLFVSFIISIEDVTSSLLKNITSSLTEKERQTTIEKNIADLKKSYKKETYQDIIIKPFFDGNKFYLFLTETYKDVRLVGAPPSSIGNFGKDSDNWMWPRHTGDFSMFRIYADKNNKPAEYSAENVPYKPKRSLSISLKGLKEGDFTMVFGFPGKTNEYLSSYAVKQIATSSDPLKIEIRRNVLETMGSFMRKDEGIKIQYAAKYASVENAYKKWQGEVLGLNKSNAVQKKIDFENSLRNKISNNKDYMTSYGNLLDELSSAYGEIEPFAFARDCYSEIMPRIEIFNICSALNTYITNNKQKDAAANINRNQATIDKIGDIYKEYNAAVDKILFEKLMAIYLAKMNPQDQSTLLKQLLASGKDLKQISDDLYNNSLLNQPDSLIGILKNNKEAINILQKDPAFLLYTDIADAYNKNIAQQVSSLQSKINRLQRSYMEAQLTILKDKRFYPDANSTLRVTYGNVKGYQPRDGMKYHFYTYMDGIMEKYKPGDYEFDVPQKLIDLYRKKDFGRYGVNGRQPVCFIASNHTTGGNSGSPALDAYGNLVGLNFDRVWEGTMSDINYDASICRNIMVDIRYVLFIIDKFAGAKNLIDEMKIN